MKASFLKKMWIIIVTVTSTLSICFLVFYLRLTRTYNREYADSVLRWWSGVLLGVVGASWEVYDKHNVTIKPGRPHIIMTNHRSYFDIPLSFVSLPGSIRMLVKDGTFSTDSIGISSS